MSEDDVAVVLAAADSFVAPPADDRALANEPHNDFGNGRRLIARRGQNMIWVEEAGWYVWDDRRWRRDQEGASALRLTHETAEAIKAEALALRAEADAELGDAALMLDAAVSADEPKPVAAWRKRIESHYKWAVASGNHGRGVTMLAAAQPYLTRGPGELDANPDLLCVANGTLELNLAPDIRLRAHDRADLITRISPVAYDRNAEALEFRRFIARVLPEKNIAKFTQTLFGYCLTGHISEQVMAILTGGGANGKSTLLNCVAGVMGDHAMAGPVESFLYQDRNSGDKASPDLARLPGARLVTVSEPEVGARLSESRVKSITGGERITVRRLHRDFFEFNPAFKLVLSCNVKPTIRGSDDGIWRRVLIVPFDMQIPPAERIKDYHKELLAKEGPGILNWLLDGERMHRADGLAVPEEISSATDEYRQDSDPIGEFLKTETEEDRVAELKAAEFHADYVAWAKEAAITPVSQTLFGRRLADRGLHKHKKADGAYYTGRMLKPSALERRRKVGNDAPPPDGPADYRV